MGTLSSCLNKNGLSEHEAAILRGATDDNVKDGDSSHVAAVRAVSDFVEQLEKERAGIVAQVEAKGGKATDAPFKLSDLDDLTSVLRAGKETSEAPVSSDEPMTAEQAKKLFEWRDMGQRDGTKSHALYFYENADDFANHRGGAQYGEVESYQGGRWMLDGEILPSLKDAKKAAVEKAVVRLKRDGYVVKDADDTIGWDSMSVDERQALAVKSGWNAGADNHISSIGKRISDTKWADISEHTRKTLEAFHATGKGQEYAQKEAVPDGYKEVGRSFFGGTFEKPIYAPFAVGDTVRSKAGGYSGKVDGFIGGPIVEKAIVQWDNGTISNVSWGEVESASQETKLSGNRRDPLKASIFNPYEDGDVVSIGGKEWQIRNETSGWYLTSTGNWRGTHPTINGIKAMMDLVGDIEQAVVASEPAKADGVTRSVAGGQDGINGYFYKGGQFLPSTMAEPGRWKVGKKWITSGKEMIEPGVFAVQPTPFSRSILASLGAYVSVDDGVLRMRDGVNFNGTPINRDTMTRLGVNGVQGKDEISYGELVDAYNNGQRWFDVKPDAETVTTEETEQKNDRLNMRHTAKLSDILTPAGAIKSDARNGAGAIWYHQGDPQHIQFAAKVTFGDKPADPESIARWEKLKKAQELGYKLRNYKAGSLGTVWILEKDKVALTKDGFNAITDPVFDRPEAGPSEAGFDSMKSRQAEYATKMAEWFATLPESTLQSGSALATKINQTPIGEWATVERDKYSKNGEVRFAFRNKDDNLDVYVPGGETYFSQVHHIIALAGESKNKGDREWFQVDYDAKRKADENVENNVPATDALKEYEFIKDEPVAAESSPKSLVEQHVEMVSKLHDGELNVVQFKAAYAKILNDKEAIEAELSKSKKDELLNMRGGMFAYRYRSDTKPKIIEELYDRMLDDFKLGKSIGGYYVTSASSKTNAIAKIVDSLTQDDLEEFAATVKANRAERAQQREEYKAAISDPKTLEDFRTYMRAKTDKGMTADEARLSLTPEQRAEYDNLAAEDSRKNRINRKETAQASVTAAAQTTSGQIFETKHTKTGEDLFVVKTADRVDREIYNQWNATAKRLGGYYSSYKGNGAIPGFTFKSRENADAFLQFLGGDTVAAQDVVKADRDSYADDRSQSAVERLNEMADRLEDKADESLGYERKANTARRARFAASAEAAANSDKALAKTMRNIAEAIANGTTKFLDKVRQKAQVELLRSTISNAKYAEIQSKYTSYLNQEQHKGEPATAETADYARWPQYTAFRSDLARLGRELSQIDGAKLLGQRLLKVADDVSAEYKKFAKENLYKVSVFSMKKEGSDVSYPAIFGTEEKAEAAIQRSGYKGKATVVSFKRGEHMVIMGPEMAREKGIWQGDDDKRMTLTPEFGQEIVDKNKAFGKRNRISMPYVFDNVSQERSRWKAMGIETPAEMRAALREFISMQERPAEADKIKQMERAMIGRKSDGLDFFPTPASTAQDMIDAAEIEPGMSVLEPSAGMGHIAEQIREAGVEPDVVEYSNDRRELLEEKGFRVVGSDFIAITPRDYTFGDVFRAPDGTLGVMRGSGGLGSNRVGLDPLDENGQPDSRRMIWIDRDELVGVEKRSGNSGYDRILMNPPFSDRRDAQHVQHAYSLLKPGGRIVAIMGEGVFFGQDKKAQEFREWLDSVGGESEKLAPGTFLDPSLPVNTSVSARMVVINKPESDASDIPSVLRRGDQTDTPAFRKWFGESAVVDQDGKPLRVYHGTRGDFSSFDMAKSGSNWRHGEGAFFFSGSKQSASNYATRGGDGGNVMPVYLTIKNPYTSVALDPIDRYDNSIRPERYSLEAQGYDGVIIKSAEGRGDLYVVFGPTQIKSAIGNNGDFDENNPSIVLRRNAGSDRAETSVFIDHPTAKAKAIDLLAGLGFPSEPVVVERFSELPQAVQDEAKNQDSNEKTTKGVLHGDVIYIVSSNIKSIADLEETVFHEAIGHFGMRKLLGDGFIQQANALFVKLGGIKGLSEIAEKRGFGKIYAEYVRGVANARTKDARFTDRIAKLVLTEEVFAHIAEKRPGLIDQFKALVGKFRAWLRKNGFAMLAEYGETDILHLLNESRDNLKKRGSSYATEIVPGVMNRDEEESDFDLDFVNDVVTEMSFEDRAFRHVISNSKTIQGNMKSAYPGAEYLGEDPTQHDLDTNHFADRRLTFAAKSGRIFYVYTKGNELWVDMSRLLNGDRGGSIYHALANYAHNAGKVFVGDPGGMSEDAIIRRTSAMLSSALRFGTTEHFQPGKEQTEGVPDQGIEPLEWRGNDMDKTKSLIHTYVKTLQNNYPGIEKYKYDFDTRKFEDDTGRWVSPERLESGAATSSGRASRAGEASLRRGIFLQSLASSESSQRPGILEQFINGNVQYSREDQLAAVFRRSLPEIAGDVRQRLEDTFKGDTAKTFNWFHKTLGTQFHKAKVDQHFGRVFRRAQRFIDDVARYGTEAANMAEDLLPKMDTIAGAFREIRNNKRDTADQKAIAAPIFDGTLFEDEEGNKGRVWTDSELRNNYNLNDRQIGLYRQFRNAVNHSLETLAIAEMNKVARVNELEAPAKEMSMDRLAKFYSNQYADRLQDLREQYDRLTKTYEANDKLMRLNADNLRLTREEYHTAKLQMDHDYAFKQKQINDQIESLEVMDKAFKDKAATIRKLQNEGYAPLMRFGKYTVDVVESVPAVGDDGKPIIDTDTGEMVMEEKRVFFSMFETEREAREAERIMNEEYPKAIVSRGVSSEDGWQLFGAANPGSLEMLARLVGKEDEVIQKFYKEAVASRSAMKRLIHRQGIEGYSKDVTRSLASFIMSNARATASADHFGDIMEAAADIPQSKGDVKDEAIKLINYIRDPNEEAGAFRGLLFMQYLGGSIASAAVNLTQTVLTTSPYLHQYGGKATDLVSAASLATKRMRGKSVDIEPALAEALTLAEDEGVVAPHNIHALMGYSGAQSFTQSKVLRMASHVWGSLFGMAEQFNRETTFIAAFKLANTMGKDGLRAAYEKQVALSQDRGLQPPSFESFSSPYEFAKNAVNETQFVLSKAARPNWARGAVGATLLTFKQFSINMIELFKRLPNKERAMMLGTLIVMSGVGGAPGSDDLDDLIDTIGQALGYNTNSKKWKDQAAAEIFGKVGGDFVMSGVSAFLPLDIANRLGMGNLIPASGLLKKSNSGHHERDYAELMGAGGGYVKSVMDAWDYTLQGRYGMAAAQGFLPKGLKDVSKAYDMARTGTYDDTHGRRVTDVDTLDALVKAIGFQPSKVADIQRIKGEEMQDIALAKAVKASISEIWALGIHDRDPEKSANAREMLSDWNRKNPESRISINIANVQRRVKEMSMSASERMVKTAPKEMRAGVKAAMTE